MWEWTLGGYKRKVTIFIVLSHLQVGKFLKEYQVVQYYECIGSPEMRKMSMYVHGPLGFHVGAQKGWGRSRLE